MLIVVCCVVVFCVVLAYVEYFLLEGGKYAFFCAAPTRT